MPSEDTYFGAPNGNPIGKETQFGGVRGNPNVHDQGVKTWSVQNAVRRLAAVEIDLEDKNALKDLAKGKRTMAYIGALKAMTRMIQGDHRALEYVTDRIDGKVPQPITMQEVQEAMSGDEEALKERILAAAAEIEAKKTP